MNGVKGICLSFQVTPHGQGTTRAEDYRGCGPTPPGSGFDTPASISQKSEEMSIIILFNIWSIQHVNTDHKTCQSKHRLKIKNFTLFNIRFDRLQKKMDRLICHSHVRLFFSKSREIAKPSLMNPVSPVSKIIPVRWMLFKWSIFRIS
jgi:hypothetical protein